MFALFFPRKFVSSTVNSLGTMTTAILKNPKVTAAFLLCNATHFVEAYYWIRCFCNFEDGTHVAGTFETNHRPENITNACQKQLCDLLKFQVFYLPSVADNGRHMILEKNSTLYEKIPSDFISAAWNVSQSKF